VKRQLWAAIVALGLAAALLAVAHPAAAAPRPDGASARASFHGAVIDLASGWQGAQSCVVYSRTDVRCYAGYGEADTALGYSRAADPLVAVTPRAVPSCASGWLCLYENVDGAGRRLQFRDEYWNYLSTYGFDRATSSWRNNQGSTDSGALSLYNRSTVYTCGANSYALQLGVYDNQAYAVWG